MNSRQRRFAQEYVIDLNGTAAAKRAGYSPKGAANAASKNLKMGDVANLIHTLQLETAQNLSLSAERVVQELAACGLANAQDYLTTDGKPKPVQDLTRDQAAAICDLKVTVNANTGNALHSYKLVDKRASLVDLGRHLGIFEEDNRQQADTNQTPASMLNTARLLAFAIQKAANSGEQASLVLDHVTAAPSPDDEETPAQH